jgi:hypothetical protein
MESDSEKKIEWVPYANGNADAMFVFDVQQAVTDPYNEIARKFIAMIPKLGVQCMKCGRVHAFSNLLKGCPVCSRTSYAYRGSPSQLNVVCTECSVGVLQSVKCECGSVNPINGITLRKPKTGGCFIATATYGSPLAPEVIIFRQFRDEVLLPSKLGAAFVRVYYFISPAIATFISKHKLLQTITRQVFLEPILRLIKNERSFTDGCTNNRHSKVRKQQNI